jgi:quinol-cytochrome oxidoreductase complex cytochrome b subunit
MSTETKVAQWLESRLGLKAQVLRPVPDYSLNPFYWLGALTVIAFGLQVFTGLLMLIYYVPSVDQAYASTVYIIKTVPLGWLIETVHLYGAYAMILLTFLHMFRGYFVSVHKKPREMMWVIGMLMGLIVLLFGLTGYLLPWTVVSKSATDVSIGMLSFLPAQIGPVLTFLMAGTGSNAAELSRFFDLHIVVLPAGLLVLLVVKMYMFEVHGAAEPSTGRKRSKDIPWFPNVFLYFSMIGSVFVAVVLLASALFPLAVSIEFTPQAAAGYVPQPEWYFLWLYQILKFASFEGYGIYYALGGVTIAFLLFILLPFIDRGTTRDPASRPLYTTIGLVIIAELLTLTVWGYFTPGQVIPDLQALVIVVEVALVVTMMSFLTYRMRSKMRGVPVRGLGLRMMVTLFQHRWITGIFVGLLVVGSVSFAHLVSSLAAGSIYSAASSMNFIVLLCSFYFMARILRSLALKQRGAVLS